MEGPRVIIVMGVSGSGKTEIGGRLALHIGGTFLEGDDFHPSQNVAKMKAAIPLGDVDRFPWLEAIHDQIVLRLDRRELIVLSCSALKEAYRLRLVQGIEPSRVSWVFLQGNPETLRRRLAERSGHFFSPELLQSQLEILEEPDEAIVMQIEETPERILERLVILLKSSV